MPPIQGVEVQLADRVHTLRYTWPALRRLQQQMNGEALGTTAIKAATISTEHITALVWAGLLHEDAKLTLDAVDLLIEPPIEALLLHVKDALNPWIPDPPTANGDEGKAAGDT